MDDRERIAMAIYGSGLVTGGRAFHVAEGGRKEQAYLMADAVLAALGDRLLPEVPEGWWVGDIIWKNPPGNYKANLYTADCLDRKQSYGLTIADAIRDALKEPDDAQ